MSSATKSRSLSRRPAKQSRMVTVWIGGPGTGNGIGKFEPEGPDAVPGELETIEEFGKYATLADAQKAAREFNAAMMLIKDWCPEGIPAWCFILQSLAEKGGAA